MSALPPDLDLAPLPYGRQWIEEDDVAAVVECLRGDWLTQGPGVEQFEKALCAVTGAHHAVAVSSGTAALHLAALAMGVGPGDTAITSAITFVASANCIAYCGGTPYFADVDPATGLIDLASLEQCVEKVTRAGRPPKAIIPVDFAGQPADLLAVRAIAARCGAKVLEDAAHSLGARYLHGGIGYRAACCAHADLAILSFHPVKLITTGEGGAVLTNDAAMAARVRELRTHGIHRDPARLTRPTEGPWYYEQTDLGYHYRLTDLQCALGLSQLAKLDRFIARRNTIARIYDVAFAEKPLGDFVEPLQKRRETLINAYHLYIIRLKPRPGETAEQMGARRKALYLALRKQKILTQIHYVPVPWQPYYHNGVAGRQEYPGARAYYSTCLSLPMFPFLGDSDVQRVVDAIRSTLLS